MALRPTSDHDSLPLVGRSRPAPQSWRLQCAGAAALHHTCSERPSGKRSAGLFDEVIGILNDVRQSLALPSGFINYLCRVLNGWPTVETQPICNLST